MTTRTTATRSVPAGTAGPESRLVWRIGLLAGLAAAVAVTAIAGAAGAVDVPLGVGGEPIPLVAFAQLTLFFTAVGVVLAAALARWAHRPQRTFVRTTVALTALSIVPDLTLDASTATRLVLVATHIVAAAIVIPSLASRLGASRS